MNAPYESEVLTEEKRDDVKRLLNAFNKLPSGINRMIAVVYLEGMAAAYPAEASTKPKNSA